jgi:hypothetical protein
VVGAGEVVPLLAGGLGGFLDGHHGE